MDGRFGTRDSYGELHEQSPIRHAAAALQLFLRSLPTGCTFNIIGFGSTYELLFPAPRPYTAETLKAASAHAQALRADLGGTELEKQLAAALSAALPDGAERRVIVTDGAVSHTGRLLELVRRKCGVGGVGGVGGNASSSPSPSRTAIHTIGIGHHVSHALVDGLAEAGGGTAEYASLGEERIEQKVIRQLRRAMAPPPPTLLSVEWMGEDWDLIAEAPPAPPHYPRHPDSHAPESSRAVDEAPSSLKPIDAKFSSATGACGVTPFAVGGCAPRGEDEHGTRPSPRHAPPQIGLRMSGQRIILAALLESGLQLRSLRCHFAHPLDPSRKAVLDIPIQPVARGRELRAAVGRALVLQAEAAVREPAHVKDANVEAIGVGLQIATRRTSFVAVEPRVDTPCPSSSAPSSSTLSSSAPTSQHRRLLRAVSANTPPLSMSDVAGGALPMFRSLGHSSHASTDTELEAYPVFRSLSAAPAAPMEVRSMAFAKQHADTTKGGSATVRTEPRFHPLVLLQLFDGSWELNEALATALGRPWEALSTPPTGVVNLRVWATALALACLEAEHTCWEDEWSLLAHKGRVWMQAECPTRDAGRVVASALMKMAKQRLQSQENETHAAVG